MSKELDELAVEIMNITGGKYTDEQEAKMMAAISAEVAKAVHKPYQERAQLVAALTKVYPSHTATDDNEPDWMIVCIHTPNGQAGWHISARDKNMFKHLKSEPNHYDGHTGKEKYRRLLKTAEVESNEN